MNLLVTALKHTFPVAIAVLAVARIAGAQPRFDAITFDSGRPVLLLHGNADSNYVIETSLDLRRWNVLSSGHASGGVLKYVDSDRSVSRYYRAYEGTPPSPPPRNVTPHLDPNSSVSTLASVVGGADSDLFLENKARISISVPANTVADDELITMTRVAEISGLPFSRGILGAVLLDAPDSQALGGAELKILFGKESVKDRREVISFRCNPDGSNFRLIPDRVTPTISTLAPGRPGIYGSCLATAQELNQFNTGASVLAVRSASLSSGQIAATAASDPNRRFLKASAFVSLSGSKRHCALKPGCTTIWM